MYARLLMLVAVALFWLGSAVAQVNINTASQDQLDGLKGIGPSKAKAIIDYRRKNGPFRSVDDLLNVPGIGESTLQGLRRDVVVSGTSQPTPAPRQEKAIAPAADRPATPSIKPTGSVSAQTQAVAPASPAIRPALPRPAEPGVKHDSPPSPARPATSVAPAVENRSPGLAAPARPAAPALPAQHPVDSKPSAPAALVKPTIPEGASSLAKPAAPAHPAMPAVKPAAPVSPAKPAAPAAPAKPARPAQPAGLN